MNTSTKAMIHLIALVVMPFSGGANAQPGDSDIAAVDQVLDDFHDAAANGDKQRYLGHMTESAVFMGTDEHERWPRNPDFSQYVNAHFGDGRGWKYEPLERHVRIGDGADIAWFDEVLLSEAYGRFRGTGVLVREGDRWMIAHYALSFLIYNEDWDAVIELTRRTAAEKGSTP